MALRPIHKGQHAPRLPGDIDALARLVEGVDRETYFDVQAQDAWHDAARRWPLVATVLGLSFEPEAKEQGVS
jgi:hypothetical protein